MTESSCGEHCSMIYGSVAFEKVSFAPVSITSTPDPNGPLHMNLLFHRQNPFKLPGRG